MARTGNGSTGELVNTSAVVTAPPFTMACWVYPGNITAFEAVMSVGVDASSNNYHELSLGGNVAGDPVRVRTRDTTNTATTDTSTSYNATSWQHICGVWASTTSRSVYLDGGGKTTNTTSRSISVSATCLGSRQGTGQWYSGSIAHAAVWDVALTDAEVAILAAGFSPLLMRPESLVSYWPIYGNNDPEMDLVGGYGLTVGGTINKATTDPRIYMPRKTFAIPAVAVAATPPEAEAWHLIEQGMVTTFGAGMSGVLIQ